MLKSPAPRRPLAIAAVAAVVWSLATLWRTSDPAGDLVVDLIIVPGGGLVVAFTVLMSVAAGILIVRRQSPPRPSWQSILVSPAIAVFVLLSTFVAARLDLPFRARLAVSRPALVHFAETMSPGQSLVGERSIGLFRFHGVSRKGSATAFGLGACGLLLSCDLVYRAERPAEPSWPRRDIKAIGGSWWIVTYGD